MSEILLGQSYFLRFDPKLWEAMQPYPPLGALYAASYLRRCGYDVALFDAMLAAGFMAANPWLVVYDRKLWAHIQMLLSVLLLLVAWEVVDGALAGLCSPVAGRSA